MPFATWKHKQCWQDWWADRARYRLSVGTKRNHVNIQLTSSMKLAAVIECKWCEWLCRSVGFFAINVTSAVWQAIQSWLVNFKTIWPAFDWGSLHFSLTYCNLVLACGQFMSPPRFVVTFECVAHLMHLICHIFHSVTPSFVFAMIWSGVS